MWPVNMAQKAAKEKKNRAVPLWTSSQRARAASASLQHSMGRKASSAAAVTRATAKWGSSRQDRPARYWVVNRASRRRGRACIMAADRLLYR